MQEIRPCLQSSQTHALADGGEMEGVEEGSGEFVVSGGDRAIDLEMPNHAVDAVAFAVDRPVPTDRGRAMRAWRDDGTDTALVEGAADRIGVVALVGSR